jgi:nicotinamidase-related amidase
MKNAVDDNIVKLKLSSLSKEDTVIVVMDMVNGFAKSGALYSKRIEGIIPNVVKYVSSMKDYYKIYIKDSHTEDSVEFLSYPPHCIGLESEVIEELKSIYDDKTTVISKNSTNGFFSTGFKSWFEKNEDIVNNYVLVGNCTDICIMQFAVTLKVYFNEKNRRINIIVPVDAVDTFHLEETNHYGDLMNVFALYAMQQSGVTIVKHIEL